MKSGSRKVRPGGRRAETVLRIGQHAGDFEDVLVSASVVPKPHGFDPRHSRSKPKMPPNEGVD